MTQPAPHGAFAFPDRTCMLGVVLVGARHSASRRQVYAVCAGLTASRVNALTPRPNDQTERVSDMNEGMDRRSFIGSVGVGAAACVAAPRTAGAAATAKGKIPATPFKVGHMTFQSGPGAALGAPALKGHTLAADEINAEGGFLGARKIVTLAADEAAGVDGNVKELRRMKISEGIDWFTGVISAGDTVALAPVAEELEIPTIFTDGCTDHLFDVVDKKPKYVFRVTNILSSDAVSCMLAASRTWPNLKRIAHIHPDYNFGRVQFVHSKIAAEKLYPGSEIVSEGWPKLFAGEYSAHITKAMAAKPDLLVTSLWGGDYVAFYKQALRFGLYDNMKVIANIGFGIEPGALGKDHPEGILAGAHANYHFTYPPGNEWRSTSSSSSAITGAGTSIPITRRRALTPRSICSSTRSRRPTICWAPGRSPVRSSPCWKAWSWRRLRVISTSARRIIPASSPPSSGSARTCRNIRSRSGIRIGSSCRMSAMCRRRPIGPSRGRVTTILRRHTTGSRRPGRRDRSDVANGCTPRFPGAAQRHGVLKMRVN